MSFEETVAMVFQPGMFEVFILGFSFACLLIVSLSVAVVFGEFLSALIRRFIWPGKKFQDDKEAL